MKVERKKAGDLFDMKLGKMLSAKNFTGKHLKPYLRNLNVQWGKIDTSDVKQMDFDENDFKRYKLEKGDILVCEGGEVGRTAIYNGEVENCCYQNALHRLRPKNGSIDSKYFVYYMMSAAEKGLIKQQTSTVTIAHFTAEKFKEFEIPVPDLKTQQQIAHTLEQADAARQKRKQALVLTEQFLQSAFLEMFGDPVKNEKGWEIRTIEDFVKKERHALKRGPFGGALKKEIFVPSGYLVYEQYHALNNDFTFARYYIDESKFQELKAFEVHEGDIIVSCSGVYLGKLAIIPKGAKRGIINQALLKISLDELKINNHFFVFVFSHSSFKNKFYGNISGTGIPNFPPMNEFKKFQFIYPPLALQQEFAALVERVEQLRHKQRESEKELENLFGSLMGKYFG